MLSRITRSALLASVTAAVLVATVLVPGDTAAAQPVAWREVPVLESAPLADVPTTMPEGGVEAEVAPASPDLFLNTPDPIDPDAPAGYVEGLSEAVERTEYTTTYANADGTNTSVMGSAPVNMLVEGEWTQIETAVTAAGDGTWGVETNPLRPTFTKQADDQGVFSVANADFEVTFTLEGADASQLTRTSYRRSTTGSDTVRYPEVFEGVDLEYVVGANQVKETLVLVDAPASQPAYVWQVSAPGLTLSVVENGDISFVDGDGVEQFLIPAPLMWDSSGVAGESEDASALVDTELAQSGDTWSLTLLPSQEWLTDAARVYPVYVDPTMANSQLGADGIASYKSDGTTGGAYVQIGNTRESGTNRYWRSIVHYTFQWLFGNQVLDTAITASLVSGTTNGYTGSVWQGICCSYAGNGAYLSAMWTDSTGVGQDTGLDLLLRREGAHLEQRRLRAPRRR